MSLDKEALDALIEQAKCPECDATEFVSHEFFTAEAFDVVNTADRTKIEGTAHSDGDFYDSDGWRCINGHFIDDGDVIDALGDLVAELPINELKVELHGVIEPRHTKVWKDR